MKGAAKYRPGRLRAALPGPRAHGADELHGRRAQGLLLIVGPTQFQQLAAGMAPRPAASSPSRSPCAPRSGRRLRAAHRRGLRRAGGGDSKAVGAPSSCCGRREDDMTHDFYRPIQLPPAGGRARTHRARPVALKYHMTSPSVTARPVSVGGQGGRGSVHVRGSSGALRHPHQLADLVIHDTGVRVGYWRSVSHALNASPTSRSWTSWRWPRAGPVRVSPRASSTSNRPQARAGAGRAERGLGQAAAGRPRSWIALMEGYGTSMAQVAEISVEGTTLKVHRVVVAADPAGW